MRLLIDARSAVTPAGRYVVRGLAGAWRDDPRVARVMAVVPPSSDRGLLPDGVEPIPSTARGWLLHLLRELPAVARRTAPDVIVAPNATSIADPRVVLYFQDLFHFRTPRGGIATRDLVRERLRAIWRRRTAPGAGLLIAVSRDIASHVQADLAREVLVIPNGVDAGEERWTGAGDTVVVLGGIGDRKDEETAVRAWATLPLDVRRSYRLRALGVEPADRRNRLAALASSLGVDGVHISGTVPREEFLEAIRDAPLAISCSTFEAFGLPVGEALAMGAPLLCTALPAHLELLDRAAGGRAFPLGDGEVLGREIARALGGDPPPRASVDPAAWSWRARAAEHIDAYESMLAATPAGGRASRARSAGDDSLMTAAATPSATDGAHRSAD